MAVTVEIKGGDKYKAFLAKMAEIAGGVKAGILNNATTTDGKSIAEYAVYNEFGTSRIPARPFMRTVAKEKPTQWIGEMVRHVRGRATDPAIWKQALGVAGESMKSDIKDSIQNGAWTPNAEATQEAKKRKGKAEYDHPLMDTGQMIAAVSYEVINK
jgi:hypothetical protein